VGFAALSSAHSVNSAGSVARRVLGDYVLPVGPAIYAAIMYAVGDLRAEHIGIAIVALILGFASAWTKRALIAAAPAILIVLVYDLVRYVRPYFVVPSRVLGCEMRDFDLRWFGVGPDTTLSDYFATHHWPAVDLWLSIPYGTFFAVTILYCVYLYFADRPRLDRYLWTLALVYAIAIVVWLAVPVAPPWYLREHGCAILSGILPDPAGLIRVDRMLGIHYFYDFYVRGPDVYAALPSLHCAFPAVGVATAWRVATWRTWPFHLLYLGTMFAASVYFGHHWIVDGLAGWLAVLVSALIVDRAARRAARKPVAA